MEPFKLAFLCLLYDSGLLISSPFPNFERISPELGLKISAFDNNLKQQMFLFKYRHLQWQFQNDKSKQKKGYLYIKVLQVT